MQVDPEALDNEKLKFEWGKDISHSPFLSASSAPDDIFIAFYNQTRIDSRSNCL